MIQRLYLRRDELFLHTGSFIQYDGLASHSRKRELNTPSCLTLQKSELNGLCAILSFLSYQYISCFLHAIRVDNNNNNNNNSNNSDNNNNNNNYNNN